MGFMLLLADFPYWRMPYCGVPLYLHNLHNLGILRNENLFHFYLPTTSACNDNQCLKGLFRHFSADWSI